MNQLGSADLYSGRLYRSMQLGLSDRTANDQLRFIRRFSHVPNLMHKLRVFGDITEFVIGCRAVKKAVVHEMAPPQTNLASY